MTYGMAYLASLLTMVGLDFVWLRSTSDALYRRDLGPLLAQDPKLGVCGKNGQDRNHWHGDFGIGQRLSAGSRSRNHRL